MKIAIVGNGTAAVMAATHIARYHPAFDLLHVFDPSAPSTGVGEGTTPGFRRWIEDISSDCLTGLYHACKATRRKGIRFENWGATGQTFLHDSAPVTGYGVHVAAEKLPEFLRQHHTAETLHARVTHLDTSGERAVVHTTSTEPVSADMVIDATGFPETLGQEHIGLTWIPTNAALVTRSPRTSNLERTRAVARPHGWIFVIPLQDYTSFGYIHSEHVTSSDDVAADFEDFLSGDGTDERLPFRELRFPNYVRRDVFDRNIVHVGNAASFIEPLEATSIALIRSQLALLSSWLDVLSNDGTDGMTTRMKGLLNRSFRQTTLEVSVFIAWHYAAGSVFDTPFWRDARRCLRRSLEDPHTEAVRPLFYDHLRYARQITAPQAEMFRAGLDLAEFERRLGPLPRPYGGVNALGFAQVALGLIGEKPSASDSAAIFPEANEAVHSLAQ